MKQVILLLALVAFAVSATMVMATDKPGAPGSGPEAKPAQTINCCAKGECKQVGSDADCTKAGGKVVKDCKECK
ncbi:MAG: hypothetical protein FJY85_09045 [Deltaproteobacteria bacterium]|nr:hypothetical protein [Deltaproteobacteria bacterium]